jgi:hypothetical protein
VEIGKNSLPLFFKENFYILLRIYKKVKKRSPTQESGTKRKHSFSMPSQKQKETFVTL